MNREREISNTASEYTENYGCFNCDLDDVECGFIDGAELADEHPANPWHSIADGDFPKGIKNDSECMSFIVKTKGGSQHLAYYTSWLDEEYRAIRHDFFDECDCLLDVDYWMEIPKLPND